MGEHTTPQRMAVTHDDHDDRARAGRRPHKARADREHRSASVRLFGLARELVQLATLTVAAAIATAVWMQAGPLDWSAALVVHLGALVVLQWIALRLFGVHRRSWRFVSLDDVLALVAAVAVGTAAHLVLDVVLDVTDLGGIAAIVGTDPAGGAQAPIALQLLIAIVAVDLLVAVRAVRRIAASPRLTSWTATGSPATPRHRALVVGAGRVGAGVVRDTFVHHGTPPTIVGILDDDPHSAGRIISGVRVLGRTRDLESVARDTDATMVIVALDEPDPGLLRSVVGRAQRIGLVTRIRPSEPLSGVDREALVVRPVDVADLLPRAAATMDSSAIAELVTGRTVLVTGAGGSIGSELCRQLAQHRPARLILVDRSEHALWRIERELGDILPIGTTDARVLDVCDRALVRALLVEHGPSVVFHAAALKHVPLVERNVPAAVLNNVLGTEVLTSEATACGVPRLVLISSDKAVSPSSIMGATKRIAERIVSDAAAAYGRDYTSVRFGNVLGSSGSVLEVFQQQIDRGGPVTVTDEEMTRFFMTIPEAAGLVVHAATLASGGDVLVLDMGEPHRIIDLARDLIRLNGREPDRDIEIVTVGRRAGEKLHEVLVGDGERLVPTAHPSILALGSRPTRWAQRDDAMHALQQFAEAGSVNTLRQLVHNLALTGTLSEVAADAEAAEAADGADGDAADGAVDGTAVAGADGEEAADVPAHDAALAGRSRTRGAR